MACTVFELFAAASRIVATDRSHSYRRGNRSSKSANCFPACPITIGPQLGNLVGGRTFNVLQDPGRRHADQESCKYTGAGFKPQIEGA